MPSSDNPAPLATSAQFLTSAFADLATNLQDGELDLIMVEASRACEQVCQRRLMPFTITETCRLEAGDMDDFGSAEFPLPMQAQMGLDYSRALGIGAMVRHTWVREYPPNYQEFWAGAVASLNVYWPYQSSPYLIGGNALQYDVDTGHIRFLVGTFVPFGSIGYITYSGGYTTIPADLGRACKAMAASIIIKELDPNLGTAHDPDLLRDEAVEFLDGYMRD